MLSSGTQERQLRRKKLTYKSYKISLTVKAMDDDDEDDDDDGDDDEDDDEDEEEEEEQPPPRRGGGASRGRGRGGLPQVNSQLALTYFVRALQHLLPLTHPEFQQLQDPNKSASNSKHHKITGAPLFVLSSHFSMNGMSWTKEYCRSFFSSSKLQIVKVLLPKRLYFCFQCLNLSFHPIKKSMASE